MAVRTIIALQVDGFTVIVSCMVRKASLASRSHLEQARPVRCDPFEDPGELIHRDNKTLARFNGVGYRISGDHKTFIGQLGLRSGICTSYKLFDCRNYFKHP